MIEIDFKKVENNLKRDKLISKLRQVEYFHVCESDYINYVNIKIYKKTSNDINDDWPLLFNKDFNDGDLDYIEELQSLVKIHCN